MLEYDQIIYMSFILCKYLFLCGYVCLEMDVVLCS